MKRVLIVQPSMQPPGGGNGVAAWVLQALVPVHRVTVLSWRPVDVGPINRFFGTSLTPSNFDSIVVPRSWSYLPDHLPVPASLIKIAMLMRYTRKVSRGVRRALWDLQRNRLRTPRHSVRPLPDLPSAAARRSTCAGITRRYAVLNAYYALTDRIAGFSLDRMKANVTLVNSDWTGQHVSQFLGIDTRTLYPPVVDPAPWAAVERSPARISCDRPHLARKGIRARHADPGARARSTQPEITLTIVGTRDRHSRRYFRTLTGLAAQLGPWIEFRDNLTRDEVRQLMASHRYGIHGMREEHFGMAPAELARAGVLVWVPRGGGQMEIVGREPALMYDSDDDAVDKITRTLGDEAEQQRLRSVLAKTAEQFSTDHFIRQVRELVDTFED